MNALSKTEGYALLWGISYKDGQFWLKKSFPLDSQKRGTSAIRVFQKDGQLYFDVQDVVDYISNGEEMAREEFLEHVQGYLTYDWACEYIPIAPDIPLKINRLKA